MCVGRVSDRDETNVAANSVSKVARTVIVAGVRFSYSSVEPIDGGWQFRRSGWGSFRFQVVRSCL